VTVYEPVPSSAKEPDLTSSPTERVTGRDSPVRIDSSRLRASAVSSCPSATIWSPGASRTRSPFTSSSRWAFLKCPSRTTDAVGWTSAARRSSVRFARTSWVMPIAELETSTPRKSASRQSPKSSVSVPKTTRIRLKMVKTLARTMLA